MTKPIVGQRSLLATKEHIMFLYLIQKKELPVRAYLALA